MGKCSRTLVLGKLFFCIKCLLVVGFVVITSISHAVSRKDRDSLLRLPLFKNEELLKLELKGDWRKVLNDIADKRSYHKCNLQFIGKNSCLSVEVKTRGNFRRRKQNCDFPPLRFKIPVDKTKGTEFEGQKKLKYVSHCQSFKPDFEQNTIEEYLIYRMYNLIDSHSYRARLSRISFIDTITNDTIRKFGFFLEDKKDVATRNGKKVLLYKNVKQYNILRTNMVMLSLFQLMIGNADWDVGRLHNIDIMSVDEQSVPVAIPYDFDWSGIINHPYFTLHPGIPPNSKYKRIYKGYCWSKEDLNRAFLNFQELKEVFLELISGCKYLNPKNKGEFTDYILKFYELIGSKKDIETYILNKSPKIPLID